MNTAQTRGTPTPSDQRTTFGFGFSDFFGPYYHCVSKKKKSRSQHCCEQFFISSFNTTSTWGPLFVGIPYHLWIYSSTTIVQFHAEPSFSGCAAWQGHREQPPLRHSIPLCVTQRPASSALLTACPHPLRFACTAWQRCNALVAVWEWGPLGADQTEPACK